MATKAVQNRQSIFSYHLLISVACCCVGGKAGGNAIGVIGSPDSIANNLYQRFWTNSGETPPQTTALNSTTKDAMLILAEAFREASNDRAYDCRSASGSSFLCPSLSDESDDNGEGSSRIWQCITDDELCNGIPDCPNGEDEDQTHCMFYKAVQQQNKSFRQWVMKSKASGGTRI